MEILTEPGLPAPDFSFIDPYGREYRLSDFQGRQRVLLEFLRSFFDLTAGGASRSCATIINNSGRWKRLS